MEYINLVKKISKSGNDFNRLLSLPSSWSRWHGNPTEVGIVLGDLLIIYPLDEKDRAEAATKILTEAGLLTALPAKNGALIGINLGKQGLEFVEV